MNDEHRENEQSAEEAASLGVEIGRRAGDPWNVALIELDQAASYV